MGVRFGSAGDRDHLREIIRVQVGRTGKREEFLERIKKLNKHHYVIISNVYHKLCSITTFIKRAKFRSANKMALRSSRDVCVTNTVTVELGERVQYNTVPF